MTEHQSLPYLLQRYLDQLDGLHVVRDHVTIRVGEVDDHLIDSVSLEIWQLEDGLITEHQLRSRLYEILEESKTQYVSFGSEQAGTRGRQSTSSNSRAYTHFSWHIHDGNQVIRRSHTFA